jgi:hypothetical protein
VSRHYAPNIVTIQLLLEYHYIREPIELDSLARDAAHEWLDLHGFITRIIEPHVNCWGTTKKGDKWAEMIRMTPAPEQEWLDPRSSTREVCK